MKTIIRFFILISTVWFANPVLAAQQCPVGTVGYWPMDVDGTEVINNIAGTLVGDVSFGTGQAGQAAFFDGDFGQYIDAGMSSSLTGFGNDSMSVSAWVYREADGSVGDAFGAVITARTGCNTGNWQLYSDIPENFYYSKWNDNFEQEDSISSNNSIPFQDWTHIVATYSADDMTLYINGNPDNTDPTFWGENIRTEIQNIQIGWDSCSSYFNGGLDEVAIFDVTLTQQEVSDIYLKGLAGESFCSNDADGDGIDDDLDVCPSTAGTALIDGCDCSQILDIKPGKGGKCNRGTLNVFANRIGWASDVPLPTNP